MIGLGTGERGGAEPGTLWDLKQEDSQNLTREMNRAPPAHRGLECSPILLPWLLVNLLIEFLELSYLFTNFCQILM